MRVSLRYLLLCSVSLLFISSVAARTAELEAAKLAYEQRDYAVALKQLIPLAQQGNGEAQALLASMYLRGQGVPRDIGQARNWYESAAAKGNPEGQLQLGAMYLTGAGGAKDTVQGLKLLKLVAEQGKSDAYLILGLAYMNIKDTPRDLVQADMWLNLAAKGGDQYAPAQIAHAEQQMTSDQIAKARAWAAAWKPSKPFVSTETH